MAEKHFVPKADREYTKANFTSDQMVKWCPGCVTKLSLPA